jgi:hypothetical protein
MSAFGGKAHPLLSSTIAQFGNTFLLGAMSTAKDLIVFFDSMANDVCAAIRASWCEGLDCTFEAVECVGAAIHGDLERLVVIVPARFAFCHGDLIRGLRAMPVQNPRPPLWVPFSIGT